ncbi:MAG: hypothetical protein HY901_08500, partial [Deltaproteobacteria bacterium]|nr:hypothetical protein [Deltaproteobacteria bacterium]
MNPTAPCALRKDIDRHFAGSIEPSAERALREHLPGCPECHRYYERHLLLARLDPQALDAKARLGAGLGVPVRRSSSRWFFLPASGLALAAAAAAVLVVASPRSTTESGDFVARGGGEEHSAVRLSVFKLERGAAVPVQGHIRASDELAFAYENRAGKQRLMVFGVDEHRRVYWFFPAWQ